MYRHVKQQLVTARLFTTMATVAVATATAACGSSAPPQSTASSNTSPLSDKSGPPRRLKSTGSTEAFSKCMRANGVTNFPDLGSNGITIGAGNGTLSINGVSINALAYEAARPKCQKYLPHQHVTQEQTEQQSERDLRFANCMRSHGVSKYPDPKASSSSGSSQQAVHLQGINPSAPTFQAAAKQCGGFNPKG
jgi:hypothetical protein